MDAVAVEWQALCWVEAGSDLARRKWTPTVVSTGGWLGVLALRPLGLFAAGREL